MSLARLPGLVDLHVHGAFGVDLLTGQSGSRIGVKAGGVAVIEGA